MTIQIPPGYSVSVPVTTTFGPDGAVVSDTTTPLTNVSSTDTTLVKVVYPDPTPGIPNPLRSVRIDMGATVPNLTGATVSGRYVSPYDGTVRSFQVLATAMRLPDAGTASFGTPGSPFPTPTP